jgi:nitric oxide reductase subunit C
MKKVIVILLIVSLLALTVAACGGGSSDKSASSGDPDVAAGKALFEKTVLEGNAGCITCHATEPGKTIVGPSLAGIASKGEDFIHESIVNPDSDVTEGFPAGTMPPDYGEKLSDQQINQLVKYLMSLK